MAAKSVPCERSSSRLGCSLTSSLEIRASPWRMSRLRIPSRWKPRHSPSSAVIGHLDRIEDALDDQPEQLGPRDTALVHSIRDALGTLVQPASGLSIHFIRTHNRSPLSKNAGSRAILAAKAYPGYRAMALTHRYTQSAFILIALCLTLAAVWESRAKVALGKSLITESTDTAQPADCNGSGESQARSDI